jgi:hypothetical protein
MYRIHDLIHLYPASATLLPVQNAMCWEPAVGQPWTRGIVAGPELACRRTDGERMAASLSHPTTIHAKFRLQ